MAGLLFHNFSTFPNLSVFSGKGAAWGLMGKTGWRAHKKKKSERDNVKDISKYKEVVQSNPPAELWNVFVNTCLNELFMKCFTIEMPVRLSNVLPWVTFLFFFLKSATFCSAVFILRVILLHFPTFNTCCREMQMPEEHNGRLPV